MRAKEVQQKTIDQDRFALRLHLLSLNRLGPAEKLPRIKSQLVTKYANRAYTVDKMHAIAAAQSPTNGLATRIAAETGIRAHELFTLRRLDERAPSGHRNWRPDLFAGRRPRANTPSSAKVA